MYFEYPWVLIFLVLFLFCEKRCPLRLDLLYFPYIGKIAKVSKKRSLMQTFKWMAWSGLIVALASPVTKKEFTSSYTLERDMVFIIDINRLVGGKFFLLEDENILKEFKSTLKDFIKSREYDRLGLVVFGDFTHTILPVTFEHNILKEIISYLKVETTDEKIAMHDAIAIATKLLKNSQAKTKVAVLLTDRQNSIDKIPMQMFKKTLKQYEIKLYAIGFGELKDCDLTYLQEITKDTKGELFFAKDIKALKEAYKTINKLEPSIKQEPITEKSYLYTYPLFVASLSLLFYLFMLNRSEV